MMDEIQAAIYLDVHPDDVTNIERIADKDQWRVVLSDNSVRFINDQAFREWFQP